LSLTLKENTISNMFYCIHIVVVLTQNGELSLKCTELSLKRKEGIRGVHVFAQAISNQFTFCNTKLIQPNYFTIYQHMLCIQVCLIIYTVVPLAGPIKRAIKMWY